MWPKLTRLLLTRLRLRESWLIFFILGVVMMNYPIISIFNKTIRLFNIPLLYLYLQVGWFISIFVIWLFNKASDQSEQEESSQERQ